MLNKGQFLVSIYKWSCPQDHDDTAEATDVTFDVSTLEDFANSFSEGVTLNTIARQDAGNSSFRELFEELDQDFDRKISSNTRIQSIVTGRNYELQQKYRQKRESFQVLGVPLDEKILYYNSYSGNRLIK